MNDRAFGAPRVPVAGQPGGLGDVEPHQAAAILADRASAELRRGRLLALRADSPTAPGLAGGDAEAWPADWLLVASVEMLSEARLHSLANTGLPLQLLLSTERLHAMGWPGASTPRSLPLSARAALSDLQTLAAVTPGELDRSLLGDGEVATPAMRAALRLCKLARLMPALVVLNVPADQAAMLDAAHVMQIDPAELVIPSRTGALMRVSDAQVPIDAHEDCTLVLFREVDGDAEHVAIVIGHPAADEPVPVRLHSSCLTGDLLGSLRCDCGPQLQRAVQRLAETGGVLLYLAQEGRGTGLANKLRAYRLQDEGLDTLQADRHLGFREDERDFRPAAAMLRALGYERIRLLTNNPGKIDALRDAGIEVVDRVPLHGPVNTHNARYMQTKRLRAGHLGADD